MGVRRLLGAALVLAAFAIAGCGASGPSVSASPVAKPLTRTAEGATSTCAAQVSWSGVSIAAQTGYFIYENGSQIADVASSPYTVAGLTCGTTYTLGVRAHDNHTPTPNTSALSSTSYTAAPVSSSSSSSTTSSSTTAAGCTTNVTTATFASAVSAASPGAVLCLATGSYGTWAGVNKAITVQAASGATPTMILDDETGNSGFTLNGIGGMAGEIDSPAHDITIENSTFTDSIVINNLANANVMFDHDSFNSEDDNAGCTDDPARIHLAYNDGGQSGVTVQNSSFIDPPGGLDNAKDGIQTGEGMTVRNNTFENIVAGPGCNHQDAIQGLATDGMVVTGNLFVGDDDGFANFDGVAHATVTDNACIDIGRAACITLYSDTGSTVNHNTDAGQGVVELDHKEADPAGTGTVVENNVGDLIVSDGSTMATDTHNLYSGATSPDINGSPTFVGGSTPSTWPGFELTTGSAGHNAATDGSDVGIRASAGGPP